MSPEAQAMLAEIGRIEAEALGKIDAIPLPTELAIRQQMGRTILGNWRAMFGKDGALLVAASREPSEEETAALLAAVTPFMDEPWTISITVNEANEEFRTPQRGWPRIDPEGMAEDPAYNDLTDPGRHGHTPEMNQQIGAWRWPLLVKYRDTIVPLLKGKRAIDFGGLAGPVGYGAIIVDHGGEFPALYDVPGPVDTIFSSHTLEHVQDIDGVLGCMRDKLLRGGHLIAHVPSWRWTDLQAENWPHHHQTFFGISDMVPQNAGKLDLATWRCLDGMIVPWADILVTEDDGECILVVARKR